MKQPLWRHICSPVCGNGAGVVDGVLPGDVSSAAYALTGACCLPTCSTASETVQSFFPCPCLHVDAGSVPEALSAWQHTAFAGLRSRDPPNRRGGGRASNISRESCRLPNLADAALQHLQQLQHPSGALGKTRPSHLQAWRRAYKQYIKGEISAAGLADAASQDLPQRSSKSGTAAGSTAGDVEDVEPPSLAHITVGRLSVKQGALLKSVVKLVL